MIEKKFANQKHKLLQTMTGSLKVKTFFKEVQILCVLITPKTVN